MPNLNNQVVGNIGLYFVCYRLSCLGWNAMPTARNARGIDIVIYSQDARQTHTIQVKTLSGNGNVPLGHDVTRLVGNFFIICRKVTTESPECFILTPEEVKQRAFKGQTTFKSRRNFWLKPKDYATDEFREKWERIGKGASDLSVSSKALPPTPS